MSLAALLSLFACALATCSELSCSKDEDVQKSWSCIAALAPGLLICIEDESDQICPAEVGTEFVNMVCTMSVLSLDQLVD